MYVCMYVVCMYVAYLLDDPTITLLSEAVDIVGVVEVVVVVLAGKLDRIGFIHLLLLCMRIC